MLFHRETYLEKASNRLDHLTESLSDIADEQSATALGVVSIAIGLTEIAAPKQLERIMGLSNGQNTGILRVLGVREIMHGIDLLSHKDPAPGLWSRVAGDVLDNVLLGMAAMKTKRPGGLMGVAAAVLPVVVADMMLAPRLSAKP
jgi:hypothetical protein